MLARRFVVNNDCANCVSIGKCLEVRTRTRL